MMKDLELEIQLPASLTAEESDLRQKTLKVGQVARALSIFRADRVIIYDDDDPNVDDQEEEASLIGTLLNYIETPQYLRKPLFPYMEELRYAGLLPPLRTPHHPLKDERNEEGDYREAVVLDSGEGETRLDIGLSEDGIFRGELEENTRVTVRLGEELGPGEREVYLGGEDELGEYWGYEVLRAGSLAQSLNKTKSDYIIGTSRRGKDLHVAMQGIESEEIGSLKLAFGGPYQGLFEICEKQGTDHGDLFDVVVNTIPEQGTETVRSEEALIASLAIMNTTIRRK